MKTDQRKTPKPRNKVARYMLEHKDEYRVRIVYDKRKREPKLKPRLIELELDNDYPDFS